MIVGMVELRAEELSMVDGYLLLREVVALGLRAQELMVVWQQHLDRVGVL